MTLRRGRGNVFGSDEYEVSNVARASVYRAAGLTLVANVATAVPWDTLEYDTDGLFTLTSPTKFSTRTAGIYSLNTWLPFQNDATGYRQISFRKNGVGSLAIAAIPGSAATYNWFGCSVFASLLSGDYVEVVAISSAGGVGLNIIGAVLPDHSNGFQACLISTI